MREKQENRFWIIREWLQVAREMLLVVFLAAAVLYVIVAMLEGRVDVSPELLRSSSGLWLR
jgi:hypothetical protein